MSEIMNIDPTYEIRKKAFEKRKKFSEACRDAFGSGEQMAVKLAEYGIEVTPPTCRSWINCDSDPSILKAYSVAAVIDILDEERIAKIRARQARVRAL